MMASNVYYVDDNLNERGHHLIHRKGCPQLNYLQSYTALGAFNSQEIAQQMARRLYYQIEFCPYCCKTSAQPLGNKPSTSENRSSKHPEHGGDKLH